MKTKNIAVVIVSILVSLVSMTFDSFATFNDVETNRYITSINKMHDLGIMHGVGDNNFNPDGNVTREQFATIIVKILKLEDNANLNKSGSVFSDVEVGRWSVGYINEAYHNGLITGKTDGLFYPEENITFGQLCTILVKTLGYTDLDVIGAWPNNYVNKARDLEITRNIDISPFDYVKRDQIAYILDRCLDTNIKNMNVTLARSFDMYVEDIVVANSVTNENIKYNQIGTINNGILDKNGAIGIVDIGEKYDFVIKDGAVTKAIKLDNRIEKITVVDYKEGIVNYYKDDKILSITLSEKNNYYYNGAKVRFDNLGDIIKRNSVLVILYDRINDMIIEAVTIIDAIHSAPQVVNEVMLRGGMAGIYDLNKLPILKEGKYITIKDIENKDVIYKITSYFGENSYYEVISNTVQGEITDILPNKLAPSSVEIEKTSYPISKYMPIERITDVDNGYEVGEKVCAILGYDGKVVDLMDKDVKAGKYQKMRILGNSKSIDTYKDNQVLTDKGTYYVLDGLEELELGAKYELLIDNDTIVKVGKKTKNQLEISVRNVDGQKITYGKDGDIMLLPTTAKYYYNGAVKTYQEIIGVLKYNSSIIFVYNENETGYEYGIVIEPIYSEPKIVRGYDPYQKYEYAGFKYNRDTPVIIDDKTTDIYAIRNNTIMYMVSDYWGDNQYILILDTKVYGTIEEFLPTRLKVNSIRVSLSDGTSKIYTFSEYFNINTITENLKMNAYKEGTSVTLFLDKDGKILYLD